MVKIQVSGIEYHNNKDAFKKLMKSKGIAWRGNMNNPLWKNDSVEVRAIFVREMDVTLQATFDIVGSDEEIVQFITNKMHGSEVKESKEYNNKAKEEIDFFIKFMRPDFEDMKKRGCPKKLLKLYINEWEERLEQEMKTINTRYGININT